MSSIGETLFRLRTEKHWSRQKLADKSGKSAMTIYRIETGKRMPYTDTLISIATALGVSISDFWDDPDEHESDRSDSHERSNARVVPMDFSVRIPLLASIPAGDWKEWIDDFPVGHGEGTVPRFGVPGDHTFALRVQGDSMIPDLYPDDLLIINPDVSFTRVRGGVGVVKLNGEYKIRKVYQMGDTYRLEPSNRAYEPETIPVAGTTIFKVSLRISAHDEDIF